LSNFFILLVCAFYHYVPLCNDFLFLLQIDDASVPPEKVADKFVSGTGCSDGVDPIEPQSSIGVEVSDAEQGKTAEVSDAEQGILVRVDAIQTVLTPFRDDIWNRRQVSVGDRGVLPTRPRNRRG